MLLDVTVSTNLTYLRALRCSRPCRYLRPYAREASRFARLGQAPASSPSIRTSPAISAQSSSQGPSYPS